MNKKSLKTWYDRSIIWWWNDITDWTEIRWIRTVYKKAPFFSSGHVPQYYSFTEQYFADYTAHLSASIKFVPFYTEKPGKYPVRGLSIPLRGIWLSVISDHFDIFLPLFECNPNSYSIQSSQYYPILVESWRFPAHASYCPLSQYEIHLFSRTSLDIPLIVFFLFRFFLFIFL